MEDVAVKGDRSKEILLIRGTCACASHKGKVYPLLKFLAVRQVNTHNPTTAL